MNVRQYSDNEVTKLLTATGSFFAFSARQFEEKKVDGVVYVNMGAGLTAPKDKAQELRDGFDRINKETIRLDLEHNGKERIIRRELANHECTYTGDYADCIDALEGYGITDEEIISVFNEMMKE